MPEKGEVYFYDKEEFHGNKKSFKKDHKDLRDDDWANRIESFELGPHTSITVYTDTDYKGESQNFSKDHKHLHDFKHFHRKIKSFHFN